MLFRKFAFVLDADYGIELDLDSIENFLHQHKVQVVQQLNKQGIFVHHLRVQKTIYLHLPEATPSLVDGSLSNQEVIGLFS